MAASAQNNVTLWTRAQENIAHQGMYNGNISWMETDLKLFKKPQAMLYKYDQLNRITKSRSLEFSNGNYAVRTGDKKYDENYSYDANGNILTLQRRDNAATLADDFNYSYYANSNKLEKHKTTGGTYVYDAIGNLITDNNEGLAITWTPSGKVRSVTKPDTTIYFRYDAMGNRIAKIVSTASKNDTTTYVRDASGNVMSIYKNRVVSEVPIYGSSRIGEYMGKEKEGYQTFNLRKYELSNHLGNVLAVISDKVNLYSHNNTVLDSARATVVSASDYYPFGLAMKGRQFNEKNYRYGFNGKENDDEFSWQDYGERMYLQRIGRFSSPDPLIIYKQQYSELSSYQFASNTPIQAIDLDGLEVYAVYYKAANTLGLIPDISQTNPKLGYKYVSAHEYSKLTPEMKSKANYGILVKNVFTGGQSEGGGKVAYQTKPEQKPISQGRYNILENKGNEDPKHASFFVLDPQDNSQYDKVDNRPGEINSAGEPRSGYNLHPGRESWGCVTINKDDPNMTPNQRADEWNIINQAINSTKTEQVPDNRGLHKYMPGVSQTKFGTLKVVDEKPAAAKTGGN